MPRRRRLPLVLIVVASLLAFLAIFAVWANRQLLDTDNWTDTSSQLLEDDAVKEQLSIFLVGQLYANVDVAGRIEAVLPPRAAPLAGTVAGGLKGALEEGVERLLARPRAQQLWEDANRAAHTRFLQVVEDEGEVVSTEGGDVTLDLKALLGASQEEVGVGGRVADRLPEDAAQLTVLHSDELGLAQDLVDLLKTLAWVLVGLALGLYALAIFLARGWRREALRATGIGFAFAGLTVLVIRPFAGDALTDALAKTDSVKPAIEATWSVGTSLLQEAAAAVLAYGVVMFLAAWLAGPTGLAVASRRALAPYLRDPRYAYGGLAAIVLLLLAWGPTPATRKPLGALLLIALLAAGVEVLRRQTAREHPDASIGASRPHLSEWLRRTRGAAPESGRLAELERLGNLRDSGVLDEAEFEREKAAILERTAPAGT
jgi:Short C-terminal domain